MRRAGDTSVKERLLKGMPVGGKTFKVHIDGYDITHALAGNTVPAQQYVGRFLTTFRD